MKNFKHKKIWRVPKTLIYAYHLHSTIVSILPYFLYLYVYVCRNFSFNFLFWYNFRLKVARIEQRIPYTLHLDSPNVNLSLHLLLLFYRIWFIHFPLPPPCTFLSLPEPLRVNCKPDSLYSWILKCIFSVSLQ